MNAARLTQLHEHEGLIAAAQRPLGKVGIWLAALLLLLPFWARDMVAGTLAAILLLPGQRRPILAFAALVVGWQKLRWNHWQMLDQPWGTPGYHLAVALGLLVVVAALFAVFLAARHFAALPAAVRRRPLVWLHALLATLFVAAWILVPADPTGLGLAGRLLVPVAVLAPFLVWRCGYLLMAGRRGALAQTRFHDHLAWLLPAWNGSNTPYGKGWVYLHGREADGAEADARSQLAGLKLLLLAVVWAGADQLMEAVVYDRLAIPRLGALIDGRASASVPLAWLSMYLELIRRTLDLASGGHVIVGSLRLFGFNVFRNTYKPLLAESVVEFWSRYYYYFKELLVDMFFYPTFLRVFKKQPKLRLFTAVFMAAAVGNMYYHFIRDIDLLAVGNAGELLVRMGPRWIYCSLLAIGIWVSMQRQSTSRSQPGFAGLGTGAAPSGASGLTRLRRIAGVWTFFALIQIWHTRGGGFGQRIDFLLSLVAL